MSKIILKATALIMALCLVFSLGACGGKTDTESGSTSDIAGASGTDSTVNTDSDTASDSESSKKDDGKTSSAGKDSSKGDKASSSSKVTSSGTKIDSSAKKTSLTKEQVIAKMPSKLKGTTIKYMYWWNPKEQMEKEAIASFEKATGITLEPVVASYSGFYTELASKVASGNSPDLVRLMNNDNAEIAPLQPITNSGFDFNDTAWDEQVIADYTLNGNCYAVNLKNSAVMDYAVIYYNKNALKAAEMENPYTIWKNNSSNWTWTKFWKMCDEFVKANKKSSETYYGATFEYPDAYVRAMGGCVYTYDSSKGKFVSKITSSAMKVGWQRTLDAISKKWLVQEHDVTLFDSGKALFYWSGPYSIRKGDARQEALKKQNALGVVPLPTDSKTQTLYEYTAFGIPKGAKNAEAVPYYLRWVLDQSSYNMDTLYATDEAKTVMKYVSSQDNLFYGSYWYSALFNSLYNGGSSQVQSVLDSYVNTVNLTVKQANQKISSYK